MIYAYGTGQNKMTHTHGNTVILLIYCKNTFIIPRQQKKILGNLFHGMYAKLALSRFSIPSLKHNLSDGYLESVLCMCVQP